MLPQTNRMRLEGLINDKKNWSPTSWTSTRKNQLKRLTNKVRGSQFGHLYKRMFRATFAFLFIREHHPDSNYNFLPDLDGCHYSKQTITWIDEYVKSVSKEINPPNFPRARPIENFTDWHKTFTRETGRPKRSSC